MNSVIISDTSCLIVLDKIDQLSLLKALYGQIVITPVVAAEYGKDLPDWFKRLSGLAFTSTLGIIARAKQLRIIPAARPVFEQLRATDFRFSVSFMEAILEELGE
jgi:predicted nucleic acid-binding protein